MTHKLYLFALLALAAAAALAAGPPEAKISPPLLRTLHDNRPVDVIIRFKEPPNRQLHALIRLKGGVLRQEMAFINSASYRVRGNTIEAIAADPRVVYISADGAISTPLPVPDER